MSDLGKFLMVLVCGLAVAADLAGTIQEVAGFGLALLIAIGLLLFVVEDDVRRERDG